MSDVQLALGGAQYDGLVKVVPKSGTYVTPIRIESYLEAAFMRSLVEVGVVRRAAKLWNIRKDKDRLDPIIEDQKRAWAVKDYVSFALRDEDMHQNIFLIADVPGLWHSLRRGQPDLSRVRHLRRIFRLRRTGEVIGEHEAIAQAIRAQSEEDAAAAMQNHLGTFEDEIAKMARHPVLVDYIERINDGSHRAARTHVANAEFARDRKKHQAF